MTSTSTLADLSDSSDRCRRLTALATGLCQDAGLGLVVHDGSWCYMPERRAIGVPRADVMTFGEEVCAGIIAHEVGHARISRYHELLGKRVPLIAWRMVLNAIEDARVEAWMCDRYPGVGAWLDHACAAARSRAESAPGEPPTQFLAAIMGATSDPEDDAPGPFARFLADPPVRAVLAQTRAARIRYARERPGVLPSEPEVADSARRAFELARTDIVPQFLSLWDAEPAQNEALFATWGMALAQPGHPDLDLETWAHVLRAVRGESTEYATKVASYWVAARSSLAGYAGLFTEVAALVEHLTRSLEDVLRPRRRLGYERGHVSGRRVDLKALMLAEADPSRPVKPFLRPTLPDRRDAAFALLIDLSGSMRDKKIVAAMRGACLVAEVLARLQIPFRIDGFQDELIPVADFHEGLGTVFRKTLPELAYETEGARVGGHNHPMHNDDGPCLLEAAQYLLAFPAHDHFMIVLSDGHPEGLRSTPSDLTDAVARVRQSGIGLVGVGLGPGTRHVAEYYPDHLAEVPLEDLAQQLGGIIGRLVTRA